MKTILVTGGAGMIGTHLCLRLLKENNRVVCVDNLISADPNNLNDLSKFANFIFIKQDIVKPLKIKRHLDEIYNLASAASTNYLAKYPIQVLMTNSVGVKNMLDLALRRKIKFLQASTSEVYGDPHEHPQRESYWGHVNPIGFRSCYDESKRFAESLIENYRHKFGLNTKIVRIFNTYGPRIRLTDGRVISNFIVQALNDKPLTIYGDGSQTRSFCYVDDLVEGLIKMMASSEHGPINLGNPREVTILDLAQEIIKLTNSKSKLKFLSLPKDDPIRRKPDIALAKKQLKWQSETGLKEGLLKTVVYFKKMV